MAAKSAYQIVSRGSKGKPCFQLEHNGVCIASNRTRDDVTHLLMQCRKDERHRIAMRKVDPCQIMEPERIVLTLEQAMMRLWGTYARPIPGAPTRARFLIEQAMLNVYYDYTH